MKKFFLFLTLLTLSVGQMWGADTQVYQLTITQNSSNTAYATYYDISVTDGTLTIGWKVPGNQNLGSYVKLGGGGKNGKLTNENRYVYSKTAISDNISKIVVSHGALDANVTVNSMTLTVYSSADNAASGTSPISTVTGTYSANNNVTFNRPDGANWAGRYYRLNYNISTSTKGNKGLILNSITFYKPAAASCTTNPSVSAGSNSSVTATTATISCSGVSSLGSAGCSISSYGFVIGSSANPSIGGSGVTKHEVGTSYTTINTSFSKNLTGLSAETTYYVRPYATNGNGTGYGTQTSFTTEALPKYTVTYNAGTGTCGTTQWTQPSYEASTTLPTATPPATCSDWTFYGWCTTSAGSAEDNSTSPGTILTGSYTPTENVTLYAIYKRTVNSGGSASLTQMVTGNTLSDGDKLVVVADGTDIAMYQETTNTSYVQTWDCSTLNVTTVGADSKRWWTVTATTGGFYLGDDTNGYLNMSSNNLYCSANQSVWTLADLEDGTFKLQSNSRNLSYRSDLTTTKWRMGGASYGTSGQTVLDLYKYSAGGGSTTYYMTSLVCCSPLDQINGSVSASQTSAVVKLASAYAQASNADGYQLKVEGSSNYDDWTDVDKDDLTTSVGVTVNGLTCGTAYTAYLRAKGSGSYCDYGTESHVDFTTSKYSISVADGITNGTIAADKATACLGETVTLTVTPSTSGAGYHLASWSLNSVAQDVNTLSFSMPANNVTISGTFEENSVPMAINVTATDKATVTASAASALAGATITLSCTNVADGYQFFGWTVTAGGNTVTVTNPTSATDASFSMPAAVTTVTADIRKMVTVTFMRDGSEYGSQTTYVGGTVTFPSNPSKFDNDYPNFIGWADAISGIATSAPTLKSESDAITEDVEYHAVFGSTPAATNDYKKITALGDLTEDNYLVVSYASTTYVMMASNVVSNYYVAGKVVTPDNDIITTTDAECIFAFDNDANGWSIYNDAETGGKYIGVIESGTHHNLKPEQEDPHYFTCSVSEGAWTITSATYTSSSILYNYYQSTTPEFTAEGSFTNPIYLFKQQYSQEFVTRQVVSYTITYDKNTTDEVTGTIPTYPSAVSGSSHTISSAELSREGYNFVGWNTNKDATTAQTGSVTITGNTTFFAIWEAIPTYDIEFSVNGAPVAALKIDDILQGTAITFPDAAAITAASAFPATDKKFVGWIEASSYASDVAPTFVTSATATANKTYYAVFADVEGDDIVDEYDDASTFPFALWEKTNNRGQKSGAEAWQMYGDKGGNPEGEINTLSTYSNLVSLSFNAKTGSNSTTLTIYYSADKSTWTQLTTKAISENTTYSDYSIDLSTIPSGAKYIKVKNSTNSFFIKSITLTQGAVSDYVTNISPLSSIAITTAPTKTVYKKGQMLNLENMVVTATYENSRTRPVTNYTVTPSTTTALATTDESFTVSYTEGEITRTDDQEIHVYELSGIAITNPTKTTYNAGETFDPAGMTVTATWGGSALDKIAETVDSYTYSPNTAFVNETDEDINVDVTISYTHEGVTKTATQVVTVHPLANLTMTWNVAGETSTSKIYINGDEQYLLALPEEDPEVPEAFGTGYEFIGWTSDATIAKDGQNINWAAANDEMTVATEFKAVFAQANAPFFKETFDDCNGTGGNDGSWSGNIASSTFKADNTWTTVKSYGGDQCARIGGSSDQGSATTPTFSMTGSGKLVFKAGAFDGDQTTLNLSATGATLASSSVTLQSAAWDNYEIAITNATGSVTITFQGKQASKARFFLDEVEVKNGDAEYSNYRFVPSSVAVPVITLEESTYYGAQNATITQAQEKQIFYSLDNNTWTEYTEPVALDQAGAVTLYAKAYDADQDDYSSVVSKSYTIVTEIDAPTMTASCVFIDDQTVTISHDMSGTEGFALQYSYDGENYTAYTEALTVTETTTIYAKATIGSLEATANATYTKGHPVDYTKVTSAAGLAIGQQFIIKAVGVNAAAGALGSDVLAAVDIPEEVSNIITLINEPVTVFELGGRSGAYTLISDSKYLKYKGNKTLEYSATADTWTITYSDGTPTIKNVTNSSYSLQYNSSSPRFTVYTSAQTAVAIYAKAATVYTLTVKDYDGSNMLTEKVVEGGSFILTEADEPSDAESGYEFLNKWTDGTNTYAVGDAVEVSANMTLHPCWKVTPTESVIDINGLPEGVTEIVVGDGKDLNVNDDKTYDNVTVQAGGKISGDNTLSVNNLTIKSEIKAEVNAGSKSGQVMNANKVTASAVYMDVRFYSKNDATELGADEANVWYSISAPFDVNLNGGFFQTDGTPMVFGTDFDLFEYDGKKRADTGVTGWKRAQGKMSAGVACLIGFNESQPTTIRLKAASNTLTNPGTIDLKTYSSSEGANANWNGVANPTLHYTTLDKDAQYFNNNTRGWETCTPSAYSFVVGTAFFVHSDVDITLSSTINGTLRAPRRNEGETRYEYGVRITSTTDPYSTNNMFVRASEDASASYQAGHDLQTLNGETAACALIYAKNYGMRLAIEEAPIVNGEASYQIGLYAPVSGEYRIEANDTYDNADLYLTYEGSIIWNLSMGEYELDLNKGTTNGYGLLLQAKAPQTPTGVEQSEVSHQPSDIQKIIINDNVFILRGGQMYDVTGKAVK